MPRGKPRNGKHAKDYPDNPALDAGKAILALLESAGATGSTAAELAGAAKMPTGTISSRLTTMAYNGEVGIFNAGHKPRKYGLPKYGAVKWDPSHGGREKQKPKSNGAITTNGAGAASTNLRILVGFGDQRRSLTYAEARVLYSDLKQVFE